MNLNRARPFLALWSLALILLPGDVFAEDKSDGFYAGPLSHMPLSAQRKADLKTIEQAQAVEERVPETIRPSEKSERRGFLGWLKRVLGR